MNKFGKAVLAASIAFGGVAAVELATPKQEASAAMVDYLTSVYKQNSSTIVHNFSFSVVPYFDHTGRTANWYIKNSNGTIMMSGSSTVTNYFEGSGASQFETSNVSTNISGLPSGSYEVLYTYTAGSTTYRASSYFSK